MKTIARCIAFVALATILSPRGFAQSPMSIGVGLDIMLPVGSFGDSWGTGFGGTAEFDYEITPHASVTGKIGYLSWSAKNLPSGASGTYSGVPLLAGIKYYFRFMPQSAVRVYGHLELGMMFGSVSGSGHYITVSTSETDFTIVPSLGVEIPAGTNGAVDLSVRYFDISRKGSIGFRAGYKMAI